MNSATATASADPVRPLPHVVAIASGKGGVGKSSIAVNLSIALARRDARVCILDADTGLANVNILLGLQPRLTLEHVVAGSHPIDDVILAAPGGIQVIPGANGISECAELMPGQQLRLVRELARIETAFDYLIIDSAAGIASATLDFIAASHMVVVVITPEPTSLTDAFSLVKLMARRRRGLRYQVLVNMCRGVNEGREIYQRFSTAVSRYIGVETESLGFLPRDESLRNAVTLQHPVALFPDSDPSSRAFARLAESLRAAVGGERPRLAFSGYWQRHYQSQQNKQKPQQMSAAAAPAPASSETLADQLLAAIRDGEGDPAELAQLLQRAATLFTQRHGYSPWRPEAEPPPEAEPRPEAAPRPEAEPRIEDAPRTEAAPRAVAPAPMPSVTPPTPESGPDASTELAVEFAPPLPPLWSRQSQSSPLTTASSPDDAPAHVSHAYDADRFGTQETLLARLRELPEGEASLAELLGQWRRASA